ncbi:MAG: DUF5712 family protein [Prevotellaceae bacterium]|jgi:hypothetical protein|nr:DUF5712 family protein [Prevotellaceae bacterium]
MHIKFDYVAAGSPNSKGSCRAFVKYMAKEDKKDLGHAPEWWFDQNGRETLAVDVVQRIDEDHQGLGKAATKYTTGSINPSEREWLAMGSTEEERLKNFKAWVAEKFTATLAGNFNKHKLPTEEPWMLKGTTPEERVEKYKKEVAAELLSKYAKSFKFNKPTAAELRNMCSDPNPAERFRAWMYDSFAGKVTAMTWAYDKKKEGEAEWLAVAGDSKLQRVKLLEREALITFRDKFEAKFGGYMAALGSAGKDVDLFKEWLDKTFSAQLRNDFKQPVKEGELIVITSDNVKIYFKLEHNRYYKGDDKEVLQGRAKSGDAKPGFNTHIHFLMATKTADRQNRINPQTKNKREFDRVAFFQKIEKSFDEHFDYRRSYEERLETKLAAVLVKSKVKPMTLAREAFSDRPAEYGAEQEELSQRKRNDKRR